MDVQYIGCIFEEGKKGMDDERVKSDFKWEQEKQIRGARGVNGIGK
jgi:hypothetical protein